MKRPSKYLLLILPLIFSVFTPLQSEASEGDSSAIDGTEPITTVVTPGLSKPFDITFDASDNLFIADTYNNVIRKITPDGTASIVAGTGNLGNAGDGTPLGSDLFWPTGIAFAPDGTLYISDTENNRVRKISPDGTTISTVATGGLAKPSYIAIAPDGTLYVSDTGSDRVQKVSPDETTVTTVPAGSLDTPQGLALGDDGRLYIADSYNFRVQVVSADESSVISVMADTEPVGLTFDGVGNLFIADVATHIVTRRSAAGAFTALIGSGALQFNGVGQPLTGGDRENGGTARLADLDGPSGLAVDSEGSVFIADTYNNRIRKVTAPDTTNPTTAVTSPANGQSITANTQLNASFACADVGTSGLATCSAVLSGQGSASAISNGSIIDTSNPGTWTLTVIGSDYAGNTATSTIVFVVKTAVSPSIAPPADGRVLTGQYANIGGQEASIARLYVAVFTRNPDPDGFSYWEVELAEGRINLPQAAGFFVESPEFRTRYGTTSDADFLELLYVNVMHRPSDAEGKNYWLTALADGASRANIVLWFSDSSEFRTVTQTN